MRPAFLVAVLLTLAAGAAIADDVTDAIDQGRKAYVGGELAKAKEALDLASQLVGQKNAEAYGKLLPAALPGWTADEVQITVMGGAGFGVSSASRRYENAAGDQIEV
jgi:hypothetical protein